MAGLIRGQALTVGAIQKLVRFLAVRSKLIAVAPEGEKGSDRYRGWNDCQADAGANRQSDNAALIDAMLAARPAPYAVDKTRVYATGMYNGGNVACVLA